MGNEKNLHSGENLSDKNTIHNIHESQDSTVVAKGEHVMDNVVPSKTKTGYVNGKPVDASTLVNKEGKPVKVYQAPPSKPTPSIPSGGVTTRKKM